MKIKCFHLAFSEYPGNYPDLNRCEGIGVIINARMDARMVQERGDGNYYRETLVKVMEEALESME